MQSCVPPEPRTCTTYSLAWKRSFPLELLDCLSPIINRRGLAIITARFPDLMRPLADQLTLFIGERFSERSSLCHRSTRPAIVEPSHATHLRAANRSDPAQIANPAVAPHDGTTASDDRTPVAGAIAAAQLPLLASTARAPLHQPGDRLPDARSALFKCC